MELYLVSGCRYIMLTMPMLFGISLMATGLWNKPGTVKALLNETTAYFYSFAPAGLLVYSLYKVSQMQ